MPAPVRPFLDRFAIGLSGLCLVHCMAGFAVLSLFTLSGGLLDHRVHAVGLVLAMPLAAVALWRGFRQHGRRWIAGVGLAGLAIMAGSLLIDHGQRAEMLVSMAGVSLLALAHWRNLRALQSA